MPSKPARGPSPRVLQGARAVGHETESALPRQLTRFIGRHKEIAGIRRRLAECRLLTLAGPGGCGKTRLALEVAHRSRSAFADGVWPIELAALTDGNLVAHEIAATLGLQDQPGQSPLRVLQGYLETRDSLLIFDNCEHLLESTAQVAEAILRGCPQVRILVTSREPLNLAGELAWRVPGMSLPDPTRPVGVEALRSSDAVALFHDRAVFSLRTFTVDNTSVKLVADICRRLDGVPLAIELAAALVKVLSLEQILDRLEHRFQILTGGSRTALPRHRTLRATVDWSYGFLSETDRIVFHRLSVFSGSFALDAAEALSPRPVDSSTLDALARLVDKSMVGVEHSPEGVRYRLLETLREYGREKLRESGEHDAVRRSHAEHFRAVAENAESKLIGPEQSQWLAQLDHDYDNLRAALAWSRDSDPVAGVHLATALTRFWLMRGLWSEGRSWLNQLLPLALGDPAVHAKALLGAGMLAEAKGDYAEAGALLAQSVAEFRQLADLKGTADALVGLGRATYYQGDLALARSRLEEGLALAKMAPDKWTMALALTELGHVAWRRGDYLDARQFAQEGLRSFRELEDRWSVAYAGDYLGHVAHSLKEYASARRHFDESLTIAKELNDLWGNAHARANLADVALDQRHLEAAEIDLVDALDLMQELGRPSALTAILEGFATLAAIRGEAARALTLEAAAARMREAHGFGWRLDLRTRVEGWLADARRRAGGAASEKAERKGLAMDLEAAAAYALSGVEARSARRRAREEKQPEAGLTRREIDVVSLVAKGLTSRQIAERLFISHRTAETHVDRILTKLNFRSRAQIAVWAAQHGLLQASEPT